MSDPEAYCSTCGKTRTILKHMRADNPAEAARKWLRSKCLIGGCDLHYRAGVDVEALEKVLKAHEQKKGA